MYRVFYSRYWSAVCGLIVVTLLTVVVSTVAAAGELFLRAFDPFVRYMLAWIAFQAAILSLLILCLTLWKVGLIRREKAYQAHIHTFREMIARFAAGEINGENILEAARRHPVEFLDTAGDALRALKGSSRAQVELLVLNSQSYNDLLHADSLRSPRHMLKALSLLPLLSDSSSRRAIERGLSHPSPTVRLAAKITSLHCGDAHTQATVFQKIPHLPFWERILVYLQFPHESRLLADFLSKTLHSENDVEALCALEFILSREKLVPVAIPDALAESPNQEVRIKYFKIFHLIPLTGEACELLRKGLADEDWRVRAMAARACGLIKMADLSPELLQLVGYARTSTEARHAARALVSIGGEAIQKLETLRLSGTEAVHRIITEAMEQNILLGAEAVR